VFFLISIRRCIIKFPARHNITVSHIHDAIHKMLRHIFPALQEC
jgi:hypothetical protein